jgi:hypothetical protein
MPTYRTMANLKFRLLNNEVVIALIIICIACNSGHSDRRGGLTSSKGSDSTSNGNTPDQYQIRNAMLVIPETPSPGKPFRILSTGGKNILKARITVTGEGGNSESLESKTGKEFPYWRLDDFTGNSAGKYKVSLFSGKNLISELEFEISQEGRYPQTGQVWKTLHGWDNRYEAIYSAWINALFYGCNEQSSWSALHKVTQNKDQNFLYNYLSLGEDDPNEKVSVMMEPDCADNPFFLRAYFAWKLGLPFGYHVCDRGYVGRNPKAGKWITNESISSKSQPVVTFNSFLRKVKDGIHSGTARTSLDDENSDYYPVPLESGALRPGVVYADPYGHTLIITGRIPQKGDNPGMLLSVDAQPDGTIGIKRFWKGNFLFNTSGVVGEPGFKAFRPISEKKGVASLMRNNDLTAVAGFIPFSLQQRKMEADVFYHTMERIINPEPLDPKSTLTYLLEALHEQLLVRVTSVANGEAYFKSNPGALIPMPSNAAGIFQAGGQWENFSTPNRDLRLLIAMDAVIDFPVLVANSPGDFNVPGSVTPEEIKNKLKSLLEKKVSELSVNYTRSDGSTQNLTLGEILKRRDAFEMAYNPNDGIEIRWGAPENSSERSTCRRHAPLNQLEKMRSVRVWFTKRLHPPT